MKLPGRGSTLYARGDGFPSVSIAQREMVYISRSGDKHYILGPEPSEIDIASAALSGPRLIQGSTLDPSINERAD